MRLPESVTAPMSTESTTAMAKATPDCEATLAPNLPPMNLPISARATNAEAAPPRPLKSATSSGIPVISTRTARTMPTTVPTRTPPPSTHQCASVPGATRVAPTATAIPRAARALPDWAVLTPLRRLMPRMKKRAATM